MNLDDFKPEEKKVVDWVINQIVDDTFDKYVKMVEKVNRNEL